MESKVDPEHKGCKAFVSGKELYVEPCESMKRNGASFTY